jgi:signal transduction histidine kinase
MRLDSLRLRLVAGGAVAIAVALAVAGAALTFLFERHVGRTLAADLEVHLKQLLAGIDVDANGQLVLTQPPTDPRFSEPLSGLYWQIGDDQKQLLRSRSLWDTTLSLPLDDPSPGHVHQHELAGPVGSRVLLVERRVQLTIGNQPVPVRLAVAVDLARVSAAATAFAFDLALALALLGVILAIATWVQVGLGLRPLGALRRAISDIRSGSGHRLTAQVPGEVGPLVEEVNALLDAREQEIARSRNRASDLAHGLKTPLAALAADSSRLRAKGEIEIASEIDTAIETMRRHVDRELARARTRGGDLIRSGVATALAPLLRSLISTVTRADAGHHIRYEIMIADDATVPLDRTDLAEVLGNLLENATRHAKTRVRVVTCISLDQRAFSVEDDGPGIAPELRSTALARGSRLDEREGGTGIGLAIVQDVLDAYGWTLQLEASELGGLKASCRAKGS